jgi:hypothetical protein
MQGGYQKYLALSSAVAITAKKAGAPWLGLPLAVLLEVELERHLDLA